MKTLVIGIAMIAAALFAILPPEAAGFGLGWGTHVLAFLKGCVPVATVVIGLIAVFIGAADMKDRAESKKEETGEKS